VRQSLIIILILATLNSWGQFSFKGTAICSKDNAPVKYLNIGIVNKNIGTVTNDNGHFQLKIPEKYYKDSIKFSSVGYQTKTIQISDIIRGIDTTIKIDELTYNLSEVRIKPKKYQTKTLGCKNGLLWFEATDSIDQLGYEKGIKINVKGKETRLKDFNFYLYRNSCDTLVFRLNIYNIQDTVVQENILKENIIVSTTIKSGYVTVDLQKYNLVYDHDFLITLEWIKDYEKQCIGIGGLFVINGSHTYSRKTSQGEWYHLVGGYDIGFYVTVEQAK
jgi:hypothetical protein